MAKSDWPPTMPDEITVALPHADGRVQTRYMVRINPRTWHQLACYHWVVGYNCQYAHLITDPYQSLHRAAYRVEHPDEDISDALIDHADRDVLNNTSENLRRCTHQENSQNRSKSQNGDLTSQYYHVHWCATRGKWRAEVETGRAAGDRQRRVSYHDREVDAALAADRYAQELHKQFASLNFA
jgi:hypothetical protein